MPMLAQNIGITRERPSRWNAPKPTDIAPLAATIPAIGLPAASPAISATAIATVQGSEEMARACDQSVLRISRKTWRSIAEGIALRLVPCCVASSPAPRKTLPRERDRHAGSREQFAHEPPSYVMKRRRLWKSNLEVSATGFGCMRAR